MQNKILVTKFKKGKMKKIIFILFAIILFCQNTLATDLIVQQNEKKMYGVGIFLSQENPRSIVGVVPNSPADVAGIQPGDELIEINDKDIPKNYKDAMNLLVGEKEMIVVLWRSYPPPYSFVLRNSAEVIITEKIIKNKAKITTYKYLPTDNIMYDIGVELGYKDGLPFIKQSYTEQTKTLEGNFILKINGKSTQGIEPERIVKMLSGKANSRVVLNLCNKENYCYSKILKRIY